MIYLLRSEDRVRAPPVHVGFVVDKVAMGQLSLSVLRLSPVTIIPPWLSILICHLRDEQKTRWWPQFRDTVSPRRHEQHITVITDEDTMKR
jgi:hypothetical protein